MSIVNETIKYYLNSTIKNYISEFSDSYSEIHGWVTVIISLFAIPLNIFNSYILYKTKISTFTTNLILILITSCDSIMMLVYVPFCVHFYIFNKNSHLIQPYPERDTFFWIGYSIFNTSVSVTLHFISIWLTVYLAFYRYMNLEQSIYFIKKNKGLKTKFKMFTYLLSKSKLILILIAFISVLSCIPIYIFPAIRWEVYENITVNETLVNQIYICFVGQSDLDIKLNGFIFKLIFYSQAILCKIIPFCFLALFITLIINDLYFIKKSREKFILFKKVGTFFYFFLTKKIKIC